MSSASPLESAYTTARNVLSSISYNDDKNSSVTVSTLWTSLPTKTVDVSSVTSVVSTAEPENVTNGPTLTTLSVSNSTDNVCLRLLYEDVGSSRLRIWDVVLFVPNVLFLFFLIYNFYKSRNRVTRGFSGSTPIFSVYFVLVTMAAFLSVVRCIVSMTVDVTTTAGSDANKILWVLLRFFLLMAEMSVLVFGLACGHLDSQSSIRRVLLVTTLLALAYSITQGVLEITTPHDMYEVKDNSWSVYGHGGPLFSFITSVVFCCIYIFVDVLPFWERMKQYFTVPTKRMFYVYVTVMAFLYFFFATGSGLIIASNFSGLCILDVASLLYFILFAPLLYWAFLHSYLGSVQQNSIPFSYSNQIDEAIEESHTSTGHSARTDMDFNGILVFDRLPLTDYDGEKRDVEEPLNRNNAATASKPDDNSNVNFFKEIDLGDNDEFDYR